jgi:hypothetical protein
MSILLGVNAFNARGEGGRRQAEAMDTWRALRDVHLANLQWADDVYELEGFTTYPVLTADSRTVTGHAGRRLPLVSECFDRLAALAREQGLRWFAYSNGDISITQAAVDLVLKGEHQGYAFCRMDYDPDTREDVEMVTAGIDVFAIDVEWWRKNSSRFRAYIGGETIWDNVYTAVLLAHADAVLLNRDPLVRHERHAPADWRNSPFARYLNYLAALDRPYFTLWATYYFHLTALRARGGTAQEEMQLQRDVFSHRPTVPERALQAARVLKHKVKWYTRSRRAP